MKNVDDISNNVWYNLSIEKFMLALRNSFFDLYVINDIEKSTIAVLTDCLVRLEKIFLF